MQKLYIMLGYVLYYRSFGYTLIFTIFEVIYYQLLYFDIILFFVEIQGLFKIK